MGSDKDKQEDKRRFSRISFRTDVELVNTTNSWHCQLLDISLNGILTSRPNSWNGKVGDDLLAEIHFEESDVRIRMDVVVSHVEGGHMGFRCRNIDLDSITHLRRLIELNLGNAELLDRELSELSSQ